MALDTRNKRASALLLAVLPLADSSVALADRQQVTWLYAGVEAEEDVVTFVPPFLTVDRRIKTLVIDREAGTRTVARKNVRTLEIKQ